MKRPGLLTVFFFATLCQLHALEMPPGGTDVRGDSALEASASRTAGKVEDLAPGKRISIMQPDANKAYLAQFTAPIAEGIAKDERVLAIIKSRVVSHEETGEVLAKLQLHAAPYTSFGRTLGVAVFREWTEQPVSFIAGAEIPAGKAAIVLQCGQKEQSIEVESIRVLKYPATTDVSSFPRPRLIKRSYAGREADAPWRKAALERIEKNRKADLSMTVIGDDGKPVVNAEVKLSLRRHAFGFGSVVVAEQAAWPGDARPRSLHAGAVADDAAFLRQ